MSVTTRGNLNLKATQVKVGDHAQGSFPAELGVVLNMDDGTAANQSDLVFSDERTTAGNDDLDLAGVLTDFYGSTLTFARVKCILIKADSGNGVNLHVGGATSAVGIFADATDELVVRPGGAAMVFAPDATAYAIGAGTTDVLRVAPSDGATSVTYDIMVIGASA